MITWNHDPIDEVYRYTRETMMKRWLVLPALIGLALTLASCGGDDPTSPTPEPTAPAVLGTLPSDGSAGVEGNQPVMIFFDRAMDPATATDAVSLSRGLVTGLIWLTEKNLQVQHTLWDSGVDIVVTVDTSLTDIDGNALTNPVQARFWTSTTEVHLLDHLPAASATGVIRNAPVELTFSRFMDFATLVTGITVSAPDRADYPFTVRELHNRHYGLIFDPPLPPATVVTVDVGTDCWDILGTPLASAVSFSFTTGADSELALPRIVSFEPADGATVPTDLDYLRITFDQPIDRITWQIILMDINFAIAAELNHTPPFWSEDRQTITLSLLPPLPVGVRLSLGIGRFKDIYGNECEAPYLWGANVEGTADPMPVEERFGFRYGGEWMIPGAVEDSGESTNFITFTQSLGDQFVRRHYETPEGAPTSVDAMVKDTDGISLTATVYDSEGIPVEIQYNPALQFLKDPLATETWSTPSNWNDGTESGDLAWTVTVLPEIEDIQWMAVKSGDRRLDLGTAVQRYVTMVYMFNDCRSVVMDRTISRHGTPARTDNDTLIFCPGFGLIESRTHSASLTIIFERWETLTLEGLTLLYDE
jgi:hypothetical protein